MAGKARIRGMRISVSVIIKQIAHVATFKEILKRENTRILKEEHTEHVVRLRNEEVGQLAGHEIFGSGSV